MAETLLIDIGCLCDSATDSTLDHIYKAIGDGPDDGIWEPHPNLFIRRIVELFTQRGLDRIAGLRDELVRWLSGEAHRPAEGAPTVRPSGAMERWTAQELGIVKLYLENLAPADFTLDDWMLVVDYLVQRYLPADDLRTEADWLVTRSNLMGRVQASMGTITVAEADTVLAALPSLADLEVEWGMTAVQMAVVEYGRARCGENVVSLVDAARHRLRKLIVDDQEARFLGDKASMAEGLQTKLLDNFGMMNRDWRRIAVTEAGENANQGMVAAQKPGTKLKRVEMYRGACAFCRSIDGMVMTVVAPDAPKKDGDTQIWLGKSNQGRSASPRKRVDGVLVEREVGERLWVPAGLAHINCRGSWASVGGLPPDPTFDAWLAKLDRRETAA